MKISELNTDNALDVFCELIPYIENITSDTELVAELKKKMKISDNMTKIEKISATVNKIKTITPILLKKRRDDVLGIVACVNRVSVEDVKNQNFMKTIAQVQEIFSDKEFVDFFKSFAGSVGGA